MDVTGGLDDRTRRFVDKSHASIRGRGHVTDGLSFKCTECGTSRGSLLMRLCPRADRPATPNSDFAAWLNSHTTDGQLAQPTPAPYVELQVKAGRHFVDLVASAADADGQTVGAVGVDGRFYPDWDEV